uniref:Uncharacterized protein n=1 Tax=Tetraselmis sp. GSL018 TaxID=582737 RepID=A0A061RE18_9CHLO
MPFHEGSCLSRWIGNSMTAVAIDESDHLNKQRWPPVPSSSSLLCADSWLRPLDSKAGLLHSNGTSLRGDVRPQNSAWDMDKGGSSGQPVEEEPRTPPAEKQFLSSQSGRNALHVQVPKPGNIDVLKVLETVPFTPSQGIRTPSPKTKAQSACQEANADSRRSPLSLQYSSSAGTSNAEPFRRVLQFGNDAMYSPPRSPPQNMAHFHEFGFNGSEAVPPGAALQGGQAWQEPLFRARPSPPSPPSGFDGGYWGPLPGRGFAEADPSASSAPFFNPHQHHLRGIAGGLPAIQPGVSVVPAFLPAAVPFPQQPLAPTYSGADFHLAANPYMSLLAPSALSLNPLSMRAPSFGPRNVGQRRAGAPGMRFRGGGGHGLGQHHAHSKQQAPRQNPAARSSTDSSPNTSASNSPSAALLPTPTEHARPRMNARQRRTERRRRERELRAILEQEAALEAKAEGLAGETKQLFDWEVSEVRSLMAQVQHQQQDNGEGALIEYHLRRLRDFVQLSHDDSAASSAPNGDDACQKSEAGSGSGMHSSSGEALLCLDSSFEQQLVLDQEDDTKICSLDAQDDRQVPP